MEERGFRFIVAGWLCWMFELLTLIFYNQALSIFLGVLGLLMIIVGALMMYAAKEEARQKAKQPKLLALLILGWLLISISAVIIPNTVGNGYHPPPLFFVGLFIFWVGIIVFFVRSRIQISESPQRKAHRKKRVILTWTGLSMIFSSILLAIILVVSYSPERILSAPQFIRVIGGVLMWGGIIALILAFRD